MDERGPGPNPDEPALVAGVVVVPTSLCSELLAALRDSGHRPVGVTARRAWTPRMVRLVQQVERGAVQHHTRQVHARFAVGLGTRFAVGLGTVATARSDEDEHAWLAAHSPVDVSEAARLLGVTPKCIRELARGNRFPGARLVRCQRPGDRRAQTRWLIPKEALRGGGTGVQA